ncbi:MAG: carboxypeptidase regulatory-like domain-containing protein [Deltaproteobacteria bacterium]|nr:carboxypeptidase regulatory-like domain-containing protein [Deltaproteobacteria bacterium]
MRRRPITAAATFVALSLLGAPACSDEQAAARCVPGKVEGCPCAGGGSGVQTCTADGVFGACQCAADPDATNGDATTTDATPADTTTTDAPADPEIPIFVGDAIGDVTPSDHCDPCGYGSVRGRVCSPSQHVGIPNALVTLTAVDCDGVARTWTTRTAPDGDYDLGDVPCGTHQVHVDAGPFERSYEVEVEAGRLTDLSGAAQKICLAGEATPIAVFWGQWDEQEELLRDLGFVVTFYDYEEEYFADVPSADIEAVQVLRDPARLAAYRILFFDCGSAALGWVDKFPEIGTNLYDFVMGGGSIYASDLAWAYVEAAFPDAIDFYGADDLPDTPQAADGPQQVQGQRDYAATIEDPVLAGYVGATTFTTRYGAGPLIAVQAAGAGTTVHVKGIVHVDLPPAQCGDQICDPSEVLQCADCTSLIADDHVVHAGPMVLTHAPPGGAGRVVYTTFHNDEQADELMRKILYYLVFQL